jgi:hypothetical protein
MANALSDDLSMVFNVSGKNQRGIKDRSDAGGTSE